LRRFKIFDPASGVYFMVCLVITVISYVITGDIKQAGSWFGFTLLWGIFPLAGYHIYQYIKDRRKYGDRYRFKPKSPK
jgi:hypothetical protein